MKRGDLVPVAMPGDFGKPRLALVIQSDLFDGTATVTLLLLTGTLVDAPLIRLDVEPSADNGLRKRSQIYEWASVGLFSVEYRALRGGNTDAKIWPV